MPTKKPTAAQIKKLRSRQWFDNPDNPDMTALYLERYMNYGLTREELQLRQADHRHRAVGLGPLALQPPSPGACRARARRHPRGRRHRLRIPGAPDPGNRQAPDRRARPQPRLPRPGGDPLRLSDRRRRADHRLRQDHAVASSWPRPPSTSRPSCCPAGRCSTAGSAASARARAPSCGRRAQMLAAGEINYEEFVDLVASSAPSAGHCNTMGTASTMNSLAEALGMSLPGCAAIPAPHKERAQMRLRDRQAHRRDGVGGPAPVEDHDARGVRERDRRQLGHRRLDQRADPLQRHRRATSASSSTTTTGRRSATTSRCWSTCSRPASTSARNIIAPAACPRWSTS